MSSNSNPPDALGLSLAKLFADYPPSQPAGLLGLSNFVAGTQAFPSGNWGGPLASSTSTRSRADWNARFKHWEKPASVSEEGTIGRAQDHVLEALKGNAWLIEQGVTLSQQGSYYNNTNVRLEADIDLRLNHPSLKVVFAEGVHVPSANSVLAYTDAALTSDQLFGKLRHELVTDLRRKFGKRNVDAGKKAIRITGITGSRAEVDVVPTIGLHHVAWSATEGRYNTTKGIAIFDTDGGWIFNFPEQHYVNGVAKRSRTACRFKRVVRTFKRLRADLPNPDSFHVPSFLVECLVYVVEDGYFTVESDDRYSRIRRIALRMQAILRDETVCPGLLEINEAKWLFHPSQGWTRTDALNFADAVVAHLGVH